MCKKVNNLSIENTYRACNQSVDDRIVPVDMNTVSTSTGQDNFKNCFPSTTSLSLDKIVRQQCIEDYFLSHRLKTSVRTI